MTAHVAKEIVLSEEATPPTLEEQIKAAIYAACNYYWPTKIVCGYRTAYLIDEWTYARLVAVAEAEPGSITVPDEPVPLYCMRCGASTWVEGPMGRRTVESCRDDAGRGPCPVAASEPPQAQARIVAAPLTAETSADLARRWQQFCAGLDQPELWR